MTKLQKPLVCRGGCHCSAVRFQVLIESYIALDCNCSICGIHSFCYPRSHPDMIDVNIRCLDQNLINKFTIRPFDGQNWEKNINQIRT